MSKSLSFSCEIIFGQLLYTFGDFLMSTLLEMNSEGPIYTYTYQPIYQLNLLNQSRDSQLNESHDKGTCFNRITALNLLFFNMSQSRVLFVYFRPFRITISIKISIQIEKSTWCAWDSNPELQDGKRRQNYGAMVVAPKL